MNHDYVNVLVKLMYVGVMMNVELVLLIYILSMYYRLTSTVHVLICANVG